jgi:hypothetical protein
MSSAKFCYEGNWLIVFNFDSVFQKDSAVSHMTLLPVSCENEFETATETGMIHFRNPAFVSNLPNPQDLNTVLSIVNSENNTLDCTCNCYRVMANCPSLRPKIIDAILQDKDAIPIMVRSHVAMYSIVHFFLTFQPQVKCEKIRQIKFEQMAWRAFVSYISNGNCEIESFHITNEVKLLQVFAEMCLLARYFAVSELAKACEKYLASKIDACQTLTAFISRYGENCCLCFLHKPP